MNKIIVWLVIVLSAAMIAAGSYLAGTTVHVNKNSQPTAEVKTENPVGSGNSENKAAKVWARTQDSMVTKVIDGDTVVVTGGEHVRLLGIDADEKGYPCYDAARLRLEEMVLGKTVKLESDRQDLDQYGRQLRYIFLGSENIDEKLVAEGLAIARFYPENQKYKEEIVAAEAQASKNKTGCKWAGPAPATARIPVAADTKNLTWKILNGGTIDVCEAKNHIGKDVVVQGTAADSYSSVTGTVFFNFGGIYPDNCFVAVIFKSNLANFSGSPEAIYKSKTVRVRGTVGEYQGKPEIIISDPAQIEIGI